MATGSESELRAFHGFLQQKLTSGLSQLSPEEALDLWRDEHPAGDEYGSAVAAIKEAIADMEAGDTGMDLSEFDRQFRQRHPGAR
jgi:hypothetical protein